MGTSIVIKASSRLLAVSSAGTPRHPPRCAASANPGVSLMLVRVPFAATQNLQPCGIDDQVDRAVVGSGQGRHRNDLVPARECGVVRGLEVEAHQAEQRVQEPLGLAEWQAEDDPQRQRGPDREVRVPPLASAKTVLRWYPRGNCILAQPDRDVAAAPEATLVLPPVPDSVLLLVLAVDSARLRCDHDVTPPISMMDWTPPPPLACSLTPIHAPTPRSGAVVCRARSGGQSAAGTSAIHGGGVFSCTC